MKKIILVLLVMSLVIPLNIIHAEDKNNRENITIKEIINNDTKYRNQKITVVGEITSIIYRQTMGIHSFDMNSPSNAGKQILETNIYFVSDETAGVYILTLKHYDEEEMVIFKTNIVMNSSEQVGDDQAMLYDKYISSRTGFSSLDYSKFMLEDLIKEAMEKKPWVLLIDIE